MMKKLAAISFAAVAALASTSALAFFDTKEKWEEPECWYNPHDCNPYDEWDPRYWMEEFEQMWDDDDYGYGGYGYWWWVLPPDPGGEGKQDIYGAFGFKGQYIFLVPEHDLVVVVTAGGRNWTEESAPREFLYSHVLKSVH